MDDDGTVHIARDDAGTWHLRTRTRVARDLEHTFDFFARAENLEAITPPLLGFTVTTPLPIEMCEGALIEYRLRLHGVPIRWRTRIDAWVPGVRFVDRQLRGPYRLWHHTHTFIADGADATIVEDHVRYALPGPRWLATLANRLLVARDLTRIFEHRAMRVRELLAVPTPAR